MVAPLPSGTVTLLFSDIEGSTSVLRQLGDRYGDVLSAERAVLRAAFARSGGRELGTEGDSFFVVFTSASGALTAALEAQRGLAAREWPDGGRIRVRMGLHTGEPTPHEDGYVGIDVHLAARVAAAAHGAQVLLTETTRRVVSSRLPPGVAVRDLGWHRLKDFPQPQRLGQLVADGLDDHFPPIRTLGGRTHLPPQPTTLIGRDVVLSELRELLGSGVARLVTLTGPGGTGKTRLAVALAEAMDDECPDGVWFVPLESARSAEVMWTTLAEALGLPVEAREPAGIVEFLSGQRLLLVLDNLEQLPDAGAVVQRLLAGAPAIRVLATSRRPLHVYGEQEHPVPPLELAGPGGPDRAGNAGAVELFVERARLVRPRFALTTDNAVDVAEICRLLDGLPLAIELVAARSNLLSPRVLRARLASDLDLDLDLAVSRTARPERHRTLRDAVAWSYGLLPDDAQRLFRVLGVFAGDFDLEAVQAVVGGSDALDGIDELLDSSLVTVVEGRQGETRVRLLRTISVHARELLAAAGDLGSARRRHAEYFAALVEATAPGLRTGQYLGARDGIEGELGNIRAALEWAVPGPASAGQSAPEELAVGLRLCQALHWYWYACGYQAEGRRWLTRVVEAAAGQDSPELMTSLHGLGVLLAQQGEAERGRDALRRSLEYWRDRGDAAWTARGLSSLAVVERALGRPDVAREMLAESIELARSAGDPERLAAALSNLAIMDVDAQQPGRALVLLHEALALDRDRGDTWAVVADTLNIAGALLEDRRPREAYDSLRDVAATAAGLGDPDMTVALVELLAVALAGLDDPRRAVRLLGAAVAVRERDELPMDAPDAATLERGMAPARLVLDEAGWAAEAAAGAGLTIEDALAEALRLPGG